MTVLNADVETLHLQMAGPNVHRLPVQRLASKDALRNPQFVAGLVPLKRLPCRMELKPGSKPVGAMTSQPRVAASAKIAGQPPLLSLSSYCLPLVSSSDFQFSNSGAGYGVGLNSRGGWLQVPTGIDTVGVSGAAENQARRADHVGDLLEDF